jgi:hypothetical protein
MRIECPASKAAAISFLNRYLLESLRPTGHDGISMPLSGSKKIEERRIVAPPRERLR